MVENYEDNGQYGSTLNEGVIGAEGLPAPYGSAQDTRVGNVTQLHELPTPAASETEVEYTGEYLDVRPLSETPRFAPDKQRYHMLIPVNVDASIDIPFKAQSLRVDNWSIEYLFIPQLNLWVPPLWHGAVYSTTGLSSVTFIWQSPPGLVQPAGVNTVATAIAYLERLPGVAGARI